MAESSYRRGLQSAEIKLDDLSLRRVASTSDNESISQDHSEDRKLQSDLEGTKTGSDVDSVISGSSNSASVYSPKGSSDASAHSSPSRSPSPSGRPSGPRPFGLHRAVGWSSYDDYDIVTVHGLGAKPEKCWTTQSGTSWVRDDLFRTMSVRQMDFVYDTRPTAPIFQSGGVTKVAKALLDEYVDSRLWLGKTEADRPVIWICHDIGGTLVKQAILRAALSEPSGPGVSGNLEERRAMYRKVAICTTGFIFLGCPQQPTPLYDLEDQIHNLLALPPPRLRQGAIAICRALARQVESVNCAFLDSNLMIRATSVNIYYYPRGFEEKDSGDLFDSAGLRPMALWDHNGDLDLIPGEDTVEIIRAVDDHPDDMMTPVVVRETASIVDKIPPPFYRHTLKTFQGFEPHYGFRYNNIPHSDLVEGDRLSLERKDWLRLCREGFQEGPGYPITVNLDLIQDQWALHSLAAPIQLKTVYCAIDEHPFVKWIVQQDPYLSASKGKSARALHIRGGAKAAGNLNTATISEHIADWLSWELSAGDVGDTVLFFKFDKRDIRYSSIMSMLVQLLNTIVWRFWDQEMRQTNQLFSFLETTHLWSQQVLTNILLRYMRQRSTRRMPVFLSCFDECPEDERRLFAKQLREVQACCEIHFWFIFSTHGDCDEIVAEFPSTSVVDAADYVPSDPESLRDKKTDLESHMKNLLSRRAVFNSCQDLIAKLLEECQGVTPLGHALLIFLNSYKRGAARWEIHAAVDRLSPISADSFVIALLNDLSPEERQWARLVYQWVQYSVEPLTFAALAQALTLSSSVDEEEVTVTDIDSDYLEEEVNRIFCGIITTLGRDIRFSHDSFYDVSFENVDKLAPAEQAARAHGKLAETCLRFLDLEDARTLLESLSVERHGDTPRAAPLMLARDSLVEYAVKYWARHYKLASTARPDRLAKDLLRYRTDARDAWAQAYYVLSNPFTRTHKRYPSPLPYIAMLGLEDLVESYLSGADTLSDEFAVDCWDAITEALRNENEPMARCLLDHGLKTKTESRLVDALMWATSGGMIDTLVENYPPGTNYSWPITRANTLVMRAISIESNVLLRFLRDQGVDLLSAVDTTGNSALLAAATAGSPSIVRFLLDLGTSGDLVNASADEMFARAIENGHHKTVAQLAAAGVQFSPGSFELPETQLNRASPVIFAAEMGQYKCLEVLLEKGAPPDASCTHGSALSIAVGHGYVKTARLLLDKGVDVNPPPMEPYGTVGVHAVLSGSKDMVSLLLDYGLDINKVDTMRPSYDNTPLLFAVMEESQDMVKYLINKGADVNMVSESPLVESALFAAVYHKTNVEMVNFLIEHGANNTHWRNPNQWNVLHGSYDSPELIRLWLDDGLDINSLCAVGTVLILAARWNCLDSVKLLLEHKPDLELMTPPEDNEEGGYTALLSASRRGSIECVRALLEAGANVNHVIRKANVNQISLNSKHNALFACMLGHSPAQEVKMTTARLLIKHGIDTRHRDDRNNTVLHHLEMTTTSELIDLLAESGAPIDTTNDDGETPLVMAVRQENVAAVKTLVSRKANVAVQNTSGHSVLEIACRYGSWDIVRILILEGGADPNEPRRSALIPVIRFGGLGVRGHLLLRELIDTVGADINASGIEDSFPIIEATKKDASTLQFFLNRNADTDVADHQGRRAVHFAVFDWRNITRLARAGADMEAKDSFRRRPLHFAAGSGNPRILDRLLRALPKDVDINVPDSDGWTPLMWACRTRRNRAIVDTLVRLRGADVWVTSNDGKWSAHRLACYHGWSDKDREPLLPSELRRNPIKLHPRERDAGSETWDMSFHSTIPGQLNSGAECESCFTILLRGSHWLCTTFDVFDRPIRLCFKCYEHSYAMYGSSDDRFHEVLPRDPSRIIRRASWTSSRIADHLTEIKDGYDGNETAPWEADEADASSDQEAIPRSDAGDEDGSGDDVTLNDDDDDDDGDDDDEDGDEGSNYSV